MERTLFYIIRHGESIGNKLKIILGHTDVDLTELGYKQAERTASALAGVHFDAIYSSDLKRAYNTALPNARLRGIDVIKDENLREINLGEWENVSREEIRRRHGDAYDVGFVDNFGTFSAPSGESVVSAGERLEKALSLIAEKERGRVVLIASHAAVIRSFYGRIMNIKPEELASALPFPSNASFSTFEYSEGGFKPLTYSEDEHLKDIFTTWTR